MKRLLALAAVALATLPALPMLSGAAVGHTAQPPAPRADHHAHLLSPAGAKLVNGPPLPAVELPPDLARLLRELEKGWNDKTALAELIRKTAWSSIRGSLSGSVAATRLAPICGALARPLPFYARGLRVEGCRPHRRLFHPRRGSRRQALRTVLRRSEGRRRRLADRGRDSDVSRARCREPITAEQLVAHLDEAGIQRAVVLSTAYWFGTRSCEGGGRRVRESPGGERLGRPGGARFPDRLVAFCSFNPLKDYALTEVERCAKDPQIKGLKLHFGNSGVDC